MNLKLRSQILEAKQKNPKLGYKRLARHFGVSPNTIKYHLNEKTRKDTTLRHKRYVELNPLCRRISHFCEIREKKKAFDRISGCRSKVKSKSLFNTSQLLLKLGENPKCYLTGISIDLDNLKSYEFDHIIPIRHGGGNELDNLGLCIRDANRAKHDMELKDFVVLCKSVLEHQGYLVTKTGE